MRIECRRLCTRPLFLCYRRFHRYAFGLIVWCLFSGRVDAWADGDGKLPSQKELVKLVLEGQRPDLAALRCDSPAEIAPLITRCWGKEPRPRAREAAEALDVLLGRVRVA